MSSVTPVLDHLVLATPHIEDTAQRLERLLGVPAVPGGSHVGRGTRNILMGLGGGAYLEIIGVDEAQPAPASARPFGVDDLEAEELVTWAARTTDIDAVRAGAVAAGYDPGPVADMSRARPDGVLLSWRLTAPQAAPVSLVPFLIDWGSSPHPAAGLAVGAQLVDLRAEHQRADEVAAQLAALGVVLPVAPGAKARLRATIQGPAGTVELGAG